LALDASVYAMEEQPLMITVVIVLAHMQVIEQIGNYTSDTVMPVHRYLAI